MGIKLDEVEQRELAQAVFLVFGNWNIEPDDQAILLGLAPGTRARGLAKYRMGKALPDDADFLQRAHCLLSIHNAVGTFFPGNPTAANYWVTTHSPAFGGQAPLDIMRDGGIDGMRRILDHLNGTYQG